MNNTWNDSSKSRPPKGPVWGLFKGRDVEICQINLTDKEYEDYFTFYEGSWYSLESEKTGNVTFWKYLVRPDFSEIVDDIN